MGNPWQLYDDLIDAIPTGVRVTTTGVGPRWCRLVSSDGGLGMAFASDERSRPALRSADDLVGAPLWEVADLARSWNFAEAAMGVAAINAWYSHPEQARRDGFADCATNSWTHVFDPWSDAVAGKVVSVVGHFPFAPEPLARAAALHMLERYTEPGDYPDSACEYLLPDSDFAFISGSALVNKTLPRLLELSSNATTVVLGPSTPLSITLFEHGADVVTGFVATNPTGLFEVLAKHPPTGMYQHGHRVEQHR